MRLFLRASLLLAAVLCTVTFAAAQLPQLPKIPGNVDIKPPATPTITQPKAGARVTSPITVKGKTTKEAKVDVTATLVTNVPLINVSTKLGQASATAAADGSWQVSISYRIPAQVTANVKILIEAVASNPVTNQKSTAARVEVTPRR